VSEFPGRVVFGGPLSPIGWTVGFLQATFDRVQPTMRAWLDERASVLVRYKQFRLGSEPILEALSRLDPLQTPPKRELIVAMRSGWTAHFVNNHLGGDSQSWTGHLSRVLGCSGVIATHIPLGHYPYPATQLDLFGPDGDLPSGHVRAIYAGVYDEGTWQFDAFGRVQPWEEPERYEERSLRDRFDRELLLRYLAALGIDADDPASYGESALIQTRAAFRPRTTSVRDEQRRLEIGP